MIRYGSMDETDSQRPSDPPRTLLPRPRESPEDGSSARPSAA